MRNSIYKDHLIYLSLIAVLVWIGGCFTGSAMSFNEWDLQFKVLAIPILFINSIIIYFIILDIFKNPFISFSSGLLYLASTSHVDVFVYRIQFQVLLAEMLILLFFCFYRLAKWWRALSFLLIGILLNTKLLFLSFLLLRNKKITVLQKVLSLAAALIIFLYVSPQLFKQPVFLLSQFKTIPLIFKNLFIPLDFTILNLSAITPTVNVFQVSLFTVFFLACLFTSKKSEVSKIIVNFLLISLVGSFIPFKELGISEETFYYYMPSFYPLILFSFLLAIAFVMSKLEHKKGVNKIIAVCFGVYWIGSTVLIQKNFQDIMNEWHYSIVSLPDNYNNEEIIKFKYAETLLSNGHDNSAKIFIDNQKEKFPNERWYLMLVDIAARKGDTVEIEKIYDELDKSKAPIVNKMFEK